MGYSTDFTGKFNFTKPVGEDLKNYINNFSNSRRMKRDVEKIKEIYPNWRDFSFNGKLGIDGEYFANPGDDFGQDPDKSIIEFNTPAKTQPGLWCQWIITDDGASLEWDGGEKFYNYIEWLEYLIENFFKPTGNILNGRVSWQGEDEDDNGVITITDNYIDVIVNQ